MDISCYIDRWLHARSRIFVRPRTFSKWAFIRMWNFPHKFIIDTYLWCTVLGFWDFGILMLHNDEHMNERGTFKLIKRRVHLENHTFLIHLFSFTNLRMSTLVLYTFTTPLTLTNKTMNICIDKQQN